MGKVIAKGRSRQQIPDNKSAINAVIILPRLNEICPPITHPALPLAITKKDNNEVLMLLPAECFETELIINDGTSAQNVYSSHIWPK